MKILSLVFINILFFNFSFSQEINGNIIVNSESVNQTNNSVFLNLENSISNFINNASWSNDNYSEFEKINLNCFKLQLIKSFKKIELKKKKRKSQMHCL